MDDNIKFERRGVRLKGDHQFDRWMDGNIRCFFLGLIIGLPLHPAQHSVLPLEQNGAQFCH
jgi:hypothetical protein